MLSRHGADGRMPRLVAAAAGITFLGSLVIAAPAATTAPEAGEPDLELRFTGRVLGPEHKPLSSATVTLVASPRRDRGGVGTLEGLLGRGFRGSERASDGEPVFHAGVTDDEGRFDIALPDQGPFNLRVDAEGFAPAIVERVRPSSSDNPVYLEKGTTITGSVFDLATRSPVEGARVLARPLVTHGFHDPDDPARFCRAVSAGKDGSFALRGLAANFYNLEITSSGFALGYRPRIAAEATGAETVLVFLEPGFAVNGRVVDQDGKGLPGIGLTVDRAMPPRFDLSSIAGLRALRARTDEEGRFRLLGLPRTGGLTLAASTDEGDRGRTELPSPGSRTVIDGVEILLERPATLKGRLLDAQRRPVRSARLRVFYDDGSVRSRIPPFSVSEEDLEIAENGDFEIGRVPSGTGRVEIRAEGFRAREIEAVRLLPGSAADLGAVTLDSGESITGRVIDGEGRGIAGVEIDARVFSPGRFVGAETDSDGSGRFRLGGLDSEPVTLTARKQGFGEERLSDVEPGTTDLEIVLGKAGSVGGRVVIGDPAVPVANFTAQAHPREERGRRGGFRFNLGDSRTFNDRLGRFTLRGLAPGSYTVEVKAPGLVPALREGIEIREGETTDLGDLTLTAGAKIRGRVVDAQGTPVAGASVATRGSGLFSARSLEPGQQIVTDLQGRFVIGGLPGGSHRIVATHPELARAETSVQADPDIAPEEIVLTMGAGGRIEGVVRDGQGSPVAGATIMATVLMDPLSSTPVQTDESGRYAIEHLAPGPYTVLNLPSAGGGGRMWMAGGMDSRSVEVKDGETTTVNFGEDTRIRVHGRVIRSGAPIADASLVWVQGRAGRGMPGSVKSATTDATGAYEVELSGTGDWSVRVMTDRSSGFGGGTLFEVEVPEEAEFRRDLVFPEGSISGTVAALSTGDPIEGATVTASPETDEEDDAPPGRRGRGASSTRSDADGSFRIEGLTAGTYRVMARKEGFAGETLEEIVVEDEGTALADLLLGAGRRILVRVIDGDRRPVPDAMIGLLGEDGAPIAGMGRGRTTGVDGTATLEGLREGQYSLLALTRDMAPLVQGGVLVTGDRDGAAEMRLTPGGSLTVRAVDADGRSVAGAEVSLVAPGGVDLAPLLPTIRMLSGLPTETDGNGLLSFPKLAPGKYVVSARTGDGLRSEGSAEIREGKAASITLKLE